jgi:hypothetical protein
MSFVVRPLGGDAPPREEPPAPPFVDLDPHALPSWRKSKGGPGLLRAAPVTCAITATAFALCLAVNVLVGHWSEYPERTVRATTVAFGGYHEDGLRAGDWERLFLAPLLLPDPLLTLFWGFMVAAMAVPVERRMGAWRFGALLGTAAPLTIAAALLRGDTFFRDRDPTPGLFGLFGALVGARVAVALRFPRPFRPNAVDTAVGALWPLYILMSVPISTLLSGGLVGWALGYAFLRSAGVKTAGPAGTTVKIAAVGLSVAWLAAAASASVGLADRLAVAVPLDRVERFLSRDVREGRGLSSYRNSRWDFPGLRSDVEGRIDEALAEADSDQERRLTMLLWRAARFDDEAAESRKTVPGETRPNVADSNALFRETCVKWGAFYGACRNGWDRLRLRRD